VPDLKWSVLNPGQSINFSDTSYKGGDMSVREPSQPFWIHPPSERDRIVHKGKPVDVSRYEGSAIF